MSLSTEEHASGLREGESEGRQLVQTSERRATALVRCPAGLWEQRAEGVRLCCLGRAGTGGYGALGSQRISLLPCDTRAEVDF